MTTFSKVEDKKEKRMLNYNIKILDVLAKKDRQFGFKTILENEKARIFIVSSYLKIDNKKYRNIQK